MALVYRSSRNRCFLCEGNSKGGKEKLALRGVLMTENRGLDIGRWTKKD